MRRLNNYILCGVGVLYATVFLFAIPKWQDRTTPHIVVMDDSLRAMLANDWQAAGYSPTQHERAYCLSYRADSGGGYPLYRVTGIEPADVVESTQISVDYTCPPHATAIHTHPTSTCYHDLDVCVSGGINAYECFPSEQDEASAAARDEPFAGVQCDEHAVVWYFPHGG